MVQDVAHARARRQDHRQKIMGKKGWKDRGPITVFPTGTTDYSMGLVKAKKEKGPGHHHLAMDMPESAILLKQWYDMKVPALPFRHRCWPRPSSPASGRPPTARASTAMASVVNAGNVPCEATPWTMKFVKAYEKKYGMEPEGYGTSSSYMAVYVLKDAIERAGTLDSDKVVKALEKTST